MALASRLSLASAGAGRIYFSRVAKRSGTICNNAILGRPAASKASARPAQADSSAAESTDKERAIQRCKQAFRRRELEANVRFWPLAIVTIILSVR
jgi:hypothetical protein